jgi:hypothetical protein
LSDRKEDGERLDKTRQKSDEEEQTNIVPDSNRTSEDVTILVLAKASVFSSRRRISISLPFINELLVEPDQSHPSGSRGNHCHFLDSFSHPISVALTLLDIGSLGVPRNSFKDHPAFLQLLD